MYFALDPIGSRIWDLLHKGVQLDDVCEVLLEEYQVSREVLHADVGALTDDLVKNGLLVASAQG